MYSMDVLYLLSESLRRLGVCRGAPNDQLFLAHFRQNLLADVAIDKIIRVKVTMHLMTQKGLLQ